MAAAAYQLLEKGEPIESKTPPPPGSVGIMEWQMFKATFTDDVPDRLGALPGFEELATILDMALDQAQAGKGMQRHGKTAPRWTDQKIHGIPKMQGHAGGLVYQIVKKATECEHMEDPEAQVREALGVIVYGAALAWQAILKQRPKFEDPPGPRSQDPVYDDEEDWHHV